MSDITFVYVLTGSTESGDEIGPYVWHKEPTQVDILWLFQRDMLEELEAECLQNWRITKVEIEA